MLYTLIFALVACTFAAPIARKSTTDVDITARYGTILNTLQLSNYTTTLYESVRNKNSIKVFYREPFMNFQDAVNKSSAHVSGSTSILNLYTDLMQYEGGKAITLPKKPAVYLYARQLQALAGTSGDLTFAYDTTVVVFFLTPNLPANFSVTFVDANGTSASTVLNIASGMYGVMVQVHAGVIRDSPLPSPSDVLSAYDYMGDLTLTPETFIEDDLARLLQFQLLLATAWKNTDPQTTKDVLKYIINTAQGSAAAYPVFSQASTLFARMTMITNPLQSYVPDIDITQTQSVLSAHLASAANFETAFNNFAQLEIGSKQAIAAANTVFGNSKDVTTAYEFLQQTAEVRLQSANNSLATALQQFTDFNHTLGPLAAAFQTGLAEYELKQKENMLVTIFKGIVEIGIEIGLAFIGAPVEGEITAVAENEIKTGTEAAGKLAKEAEQIGFLVLEVKPMLEAVEKLIKTVSLLIKELDEEKVDANLADETVSSPTFSQAIDTIDLTTKWANYRTAVNTFWTNIKPEGIDGTDEYFSALLDIANYGDAILAAQTAFAQVGNDYTTASVNLNLAKSQQDRLEAAIPNLQSPMIFDTFMKAMFDRLISVRGWVAIDFDNYVSAYQYYTLSTSPPQSVPVMSPTSFYTAAIADLNEASVQATEDFKSQTEEVRLSTNDTNSVFGSNWLSKLKTSGGLQFSISPNDTHFSDVSRVRIQRMRVFLIGSTAAEVAVQIGMSGAFQDKQVASPYTPLSFISDATKLNFKYTPQPSDPNTAAEYIEEDGLYAATNVFMTPAPFASWSVVVPDASHLDGVTELIVELDCEITNH